MRSAILVDATLDFEIRGEHVHITDAGGAVHLALTRHSFMANIAAAQIVARQLFPEACPVVHLAHRKHQAAT